MHEGVDFPLLFNWSSCPFLLHGGFSMKIKKDVIYLGFILLLSLMVGAIFIPSYVQQTESKDEISLLLDSIKDGSSKISQAKNERLLDYFSNIEYSVSGDVVKVTSKDIIKITTKVYAKISEEVASLNLVPTDEGYESAYEDIFWPVFDEIYAQEPFVENETAINFVDGKIVLSEGKNVPFVAALLGLSPETYQNFIKDIRTSEDMAIKEGIMNEKERTTSILRY